MRRLTDDEITRALLAFSHGLGLSESDRSAGLALAGRLMQVASHVVAELVELNRLDDPIRVTKAALRVAMRGGMLTHPDPRDCGPPVSAFDRAHVQEILRDHAGQEFNNFNAWLLRLVAKADGHNREFLRERFPDAVEVYESFVNGGTRPG